MEWEPYHQALAAARENLPFLLGKTRSLEEELAHLDEGEVEEAHVRPLLEQLRGYLLHELLPQLQTLQTLGPVLARLPHGSEKFLRLQQEQDDLCQRIQEFKSSLTLETYVGPQTQPSLLWRLVTDARAVLALAQGQLAGLTELLHEVPASAEAAP